jgi:proteic killer suppression protein
MRPVLPMITTDVSNVSHYYCSNDRELRNKATAAIFAGVVPKGVPVDVARRARTKLLMIDAVRALGELSVPPGNRLEKLRGDRAGQYSIRMNDQFRLCFRWRAGEAKDVELCDDH